jgi:hypothetical protein
MIHALNTKKINLKRSLPKKLKEIWMSKMKRNNRKKLREILVQR